MIPALVALLPLIKAGLAGAAVGGIGNKMAGGSFKKGALMGAGVGAGGAGLSSLLAAPAAGAAGGAASSALTGGIDASIAAGAEPALAAGSTGAGAATSGSMSSLLKQAAINTGVQTAAGMAMPQHGMTQIGSVPQMEQPDVSAELQQLMQKSMAKKGRV